MSLSAMLRRSDAVLVVIDEQERLTAVMDRREPVLAATVRLIRLAGLLRIPVVATRQYPKGLGESEAALLAALDDAEKAGSFVARVDKVDFDCFGEPDFVRALEGTARTQLLICGMETHICVTQTALSALATGFQVQVAADACCSRDAVSHDLALARLTAAGCVVTTAESAMYEAVGRAGTDEFRGLLGVVKG